MLLGVLNRWTRYVAIGAKHTAVALLGLDYFMARIALIEKLAVIHWHGYWLHMTTVWAFQVAFESHVHSAI
jgi:hypothetical protein